MPRSAHDLSAGEWGVLALLAENPSHGFALARAMAPDGEIGKVWSLRRPLVYHAIDRLSELGLIRPGRTVASQSGPRRTVLQITPRGRRAVSAWLSAPVEHVRDARSLLLLKLLFIDRRGEDPAPLLLAQRQGFDAQAQRLAVAAANADGFDQTLLHWRLESTAAAIRFIDTISHQPA